MAISASPGLHASFPFPPRLRDRFPQFGVKVSCASDETKMAAARRNTKNTRFMVLSDILTLERMSRVDGISSWTNKAMRGKGAFIVLQKLNCSRHFLGFPPK